MRSGRNLVYGYDPASGRLFQVSEEAGTYNLAINMGGPEVVFEMNMMLDDPTWQKLWLQYCRLYTAPRDTLVRDMATGQEGADAAYSSRRPIGFLRLHEDAEPGLSPGWAQFADGRSGGRWARRTGHPQG